MGESRLRQKAKRRIESLSDKDLRSALDYLNFLEDRGEENATEELARIPGFEKSMREAQKEIAAGRLTPVSKLRRKRGKNV